MKPPLRDPRQIQAGKFPSDFSHEPVLAAIKLWLMNLQRLLACWASNLQEELAGENNVACMAGAVSAALLTEHVFDH